MWRSAFGDRALTAAALSGVFKLKNLQDAQSTNHLVLFWEHELAQLAEFLTATA